MRSRGQRSFFGALALATAALGAAAAELDGTVVAIADGDTLTVLVGKRQHKVRLLEIDAPERRQAFGTQSRQSLSDLCFRKLAHVVWLNKDRYGRILGRVSCAGVDANAEQVRRGMAWVYDRFVRDSSLYAAQNRARAWRRDRSQCHLGNGVSRSARLPRQAASHHPPAPPPAPF